MFSDSKKAQAGIGPILVIVAVLGLFLAFAIFVIILPVLNSFIGMGVDASNDSGDWFTSFIIKLIPLWIIIIFVALLVYFVATAGGNT